MVKRAYQTIKDIHKKLFYGCIQMGIIPNEWKHACVGTLLESPDMDHMIPKLYRPICLLPITGKVLKVLILGSLQAVVEASLSDTQYDF